jgi:hypothetical protein
VHGNVQRLVSVVKMSTLFEEYTNEEQRSFVRYFFVDKRHQYN